RAVWPDHRQPAPPAPERSHLPRPEDPGASGRSNSVSRPPDAPHLAPRHPARMPPPQSPASARCSTGDAARDQTAPRHVPLHRLLLRCKHRCLHHCAITPDPVIAERRPSPEGYAMGGLLPFAEARANGEVAPKDETALAVISGRTRGLGSSGKQASCLDIERPR